MNKADQLARAFEIASTLARRNQIEVSREELALLRRKANVLDWIITHHESIGFASGDREPSSWIKTSELFKRVEVAMAQQPPRSKDPK